MVRRPLASVFYHREHRDTFGQETGNTESLFLVLACEGQASTEIKLVSSSIKLGGNLAMLKKGSLDFCFM